MIFNLYAHSNGHEFDTIVMPDKYGELKSETPKGSGWFAIKWPVNPHFTGESIIREMINTALHDGLIFPKGENQ